MHWVNRNLFLVLCAFGYSTMLLGSEADVNSTKVIDLQRIQLPKLLKSDLVGIHFVSQKERDSILEEENMTLEEFENDRDKNIFQENKADILGALFVCQPYCKFLNYLIEPGYLVELPQKTSLDELRFVNKNSDAYKALFSDADARQAESEAALLQKKLRIKIKEEDASYYSFNDSKKASLFYSVSFGLNYNSSDFKTNSQLQSDLATSPYYGYLARIDLVPNYKFKVFDRKLYLELFYDMNQSQSRKSLNNLNSVNSNSTEYGFGIYMPLKIWGVGLGYYLDSWQNKFSTQSITGADEKYQGSGLNLKFKYKEYWFYVKKSLAISANDSQSYRVSPYNPNLTEVKLERCTKKIFFKWFYSYYCADIEYGSFTQTSGIASNLALNISEFNLVENYWRINLKMNLGDDIRREVR